MKNNLHALSALRGRMTNKLDFAKRILRTSSISEA